MAAKNAKTTKVKFFLTAKTAQDLVEAQLANNQRFSTMFNYEIMKNGNNWIAWYLNDLVLELEQRRGKNSAGP